MVNKSGGGTNYFPEKREGKCCKWDLYCYREFQLRGKSFFCLYQVNNKWISEIFQQIKLIENFKSNQIFAQWNLMD
jgi:hypothetical protein